MYIYLALIKSVVIFTHLIFKILKINLALCKMTSKALGEKKNKGKEKNKKRGAEACIKLCVYLHPPLCSQLCKNSV